MCEPGECGKCKYCGEPIFVGDEVVFYHYGDAIYHEDCFLDVAASLLFESGDAEPRIAEESHPEWDLETDLAKEERRRTA